MRLKQIKLAGFKSFVDVTTVPFPQEMTAIVGPNGCGKSNIIDAVRWVLGESSAKNLRGDSMTDVIFNGSTSRKPIGQASVELVFDNTDQRIQGSMADRTQISIRRVVNRDSQNTYFLNGSKCRRKDITDIFLGTGLGPRSYAIIEQGMISKLIESKPQDLRVFIEEAAGVSKYKERRRETETRIKHTRENLERLADIRQELGIHIEKLYGQSQSAIRFKALKADERLFKAQLTALRWQQSEQKLAGLKQKQLAIENQLEQLTTKQRSAELSIIEVKSSQGGNSDNIEELQKRKLALNTDITRLEQNLKHSKQQKIDLLAQQEKLASSLSLLKLSVQKESLNKQQLQLELEALLPQLRELNAQLDDAQQEFSKAHHRQQDWQSHWDTFQQEHGNYLQQVNIVETKISATSDLMSKTEQRLEQLTSQLQTMQLEGLYKTQQELTSKLNTKQALLSSLQSEHDNLKQQSKELEASLAQTFKQREKVQQNYRSLLAKRDTLQETLTQQCDWQVEQNNALKQEGITQVTSLLSQLQVTSPWEHAVEMVIGQWLQASVVPKWPQQYAPDIALMVKLPTNQVAVKGSLAEFVQGDNPFIDLLNTIKAVETNEQAQELASNLNDGQSVISVQGHWFGQNWFKKGNAGEQSALLKRANEVKQCNEELEVINNQESELDNIYQGALQKCQAVTQQLNSCNQKLTASEQSQSLLKQQLSLLEQEISLKQQQHTNLSDDIARYSTTLEDELIKYQALLVEQKSLAGSAANFKQNSDALQSQRTQLNQYVQQLQLNINEITENKHQLSLTLEQTKSALQLVESTINKDQEQISQLEQQQQDLLFTLEETQRPMGNFERELQLLLAQSNDIDIKQQKINSALASTNEQIEQYQQVQQSMLKQVAAQKESLSKLQIDSQTCKVKQNAAIEQLTELGVTIEEILTDLPVEAKEGQWQIKLARTTKEIEQLGPINLAAIDEYEVEAQRKEFLDTQNNDLESALTTLESAINKIDKESRQKFKETFEQVNKDLKMLFPKVFGGGSAYLDLTGEDLLDTGVTIMARPPGKKNSTIHLLSGGEKALTALSLVFAIFRLNPAPFCMLDEVDAPLDDANVGRFCNLVKEMSQSVQFIYISHNKIAMEMASHLTGVTMHEPGVSRMVAVDIDEAIAMAEAS
ncbi:chromosome segregation protein SMC [Thalassomonas sp. M1454]|uniref:chromosome segregation protein SMC n=1 Tax=Thalassomonas sp. M1454 TaxID=2594477 RepID=UPI00117F3B90|nr:chromosome segregation protein SMC [Thalassomonas sp. M1454]TRX56439.1 chromosome segregation protein SMC [Thalassomonas sp. M1454]